MQYSHILWDFNGTLLDDVQTGINSMNILLARREIKKLGCVQDYHRVFCFPIVNYYQNVGLDLEKERFEFLAQEWMDQYLLHSKKAVLYDGVFNILSDFKDKNIPQIILSATERQMLIKQLQEYDILRYFSDVLGLDNIHANSKVSIAREWMDAQKPKRAVLIGDTAHDFEVAQQIGIDCILLAQGHQSKEALQKCGCPVLENINEVPNFLQR